jgi:hypothetical protein
MGESVDSFWEFLKGIQNGISIRITRCVYLREIWRCFRWIKV